MQGARAVEDADGIARHCTEVKRLSHRQVARRLVRPRTEDDAIGIASLTMMHDIGSLDPSRMNPRRRVIQSCIGHEDQTETQHRREDADNAEIVSLVRGPSPKKGDGQGDRGDNSRENDKRTSAADDMHPTDHRGE